jgi:hypothetical protein
MPSRSICQLVLAAALAAALPAAAQSGLRLPERGAGLDPAFARGWLAPDFDRFGFASYHWKDTLGLAPSQRIDWSYSFGTRASLGMSLGEGRQYDYEREFSLFGRYWFAADWAVSAQTISREGPGLLRLQDFRVGVQRRF